MKVLVALDGSEASRNSFLSACTLADKMRYYLAACYVNKAQGYTPSDTGWISQHERLAEELERHGNKILNEVSAIGSTRGADIERLVFNGIPAAEIVSYIHAHGIIKLVVMGHSGKSRSAQDFGDGTAKNIVMKAGVPVLVTSKDVTVNKILLAVDDSGLSRKAAVFAANLAKAFAVEVNVLAVIPDIVSMLKEYGRIAEVHQINNNRGKIEEALFIDQANRAVATAMACLGKAGVSGCPVVKKGVPSHEIIAAARHHDLLIIGNPGKPAQRGQGSILDALLGSPQISTIFVQ